MSQPLFTHIATSLAQRYKCFTLRRDCIGWISLSTLQKCTAAIRQISYAGPADMFDEYLQMGETTGLHSGVSTEANLRRMPETTGYARYGARFPRDDRQHRLHALRIEKLPGGVEMPVHYWHAYFGVAGSNNDINVMQSSPLFNDECWGEGPEIRFVANGTEYSRGYYLAYGIYPRWPVCQDSSATDWTEERLFCAQTRGC
ncbi:uncharacterized protein LOC125206241 [Salvia hispanica]|uniref:uncharacterized protein LOC125206241 n=1 Tax=Salvia hispanica TaxID=49212 RepID=UPI002008F5AD|nr:uncharacterized protein LOC125206241 [Salvia hispanica]